MATEVLLTQLNFKISLPPSPLLLVQLLSLSHGRQTSVAFRLLFAVILASGWISLLHMFAENLPVYCRYQHRWNPSKKFTLWAWATKKLNFFKFLTSNETYLLQSLFAVKLVMATVCFLTHIFHIGAYQHFTQFYEVAMGFIFNCNNKSIYKLLFLLTNYSFKFIVVPWTVPHGYWRERIILLPTRTKSVLPTTANGTWVFMVEFTSDTLSSSVGNW